MKNNNLLAVSLLVMSLCLLTSCINGESREQEKRINSTNTNTNEQAKSVKTEGRKEEKHPTTVTTQKLSFQQWGYHLLEDGTVEITEYTGKDPDVVIPKTIDGKKVTGIGIKAFFEDEDGAKKPYGALKRVKFPAGITYIKQHAFYGCTELTAITIPAEVTSIETDTFYGCSKLKSVEIPSGVTSIGNGAFEECSSLTGITIPDSVTSIGKTAFQSCSSLNEITVEEGNLVYDSRQGCNALIETATNLLIAGSSNTKIPESVTEIGDGAFEGRKLTSIEIPSGVVRIGENAFSGCHKLKSVIIPSSVTSIGKNAFRACIKLKTVTLPTGITVIDEGVFDSCQALKNITIPSGVTSIGNIAFRDCNSLNSINIPASLTSLDTSAFLSCQNINQITVEEGNPIYDSRQNCNAVIETATDTLIQGCIGTVIPNDVVTIGHGAFYGLSNMKSIVIPENVKEIDNMAFDSCKKLKMITIKSKKLMSIGERTIMNIKKDAVIQVPKGKVKAYSKLFTKKTGYQNTMKIK